MFYCPMPQISQDFQTWGRFFTIFLPLLHHPRFRHSWLSPTEPSAPHKDRAAAKRQHRLLYLSTQCKYITFPRIR